MEKPINLLVIFGGQSDEHPVSIRSAQAVVGNLSRKRYHIRLLYIHRNGEWSILPGLSIEAEQLGTLERHSAREPFPLHILKPDIVFPVLHGPNGEDGRIQGWLQMLGIPIVGCTAVGSMLAMDKGVSKTISMQAGLPVVGNRVFNWGETDISKQITGQFSFPVFIKPCNLGSSVGISKVEAESDLPRAIETAFRHDKRIIVEQGIPVREIELSVMGRWPDIRVSQPGELIPHNDFYDYNDKYVDGKTGFSLPAHLSPDQWEEARSLARKAYAVHQLDGFARADLFLHKESGRFFFNEINTIPGFTEISMFPKLWQLEGLSFSDLLDTLVDMGLTHADR